MIFEVKDLHVEADGKEILKGINLSVTDGELHVLMGSNGSGKSTLANTIMGHPQFTVSRGDIIMDGESLKGTKANERARKGIFLEFQDPVEIEGLGLMNFLNSARTSVGRGDVPFKDFVNEIKSVSGNLKMKEELIGRSLNYGFSGGEKKKMEILQMSVLKPKLAILDEPDSGLDVDAVRVVAERVNALQKSTNMGVLLITHYSRILNYMPPSHVHVMKEGRIVREGGSSLISEIEKNGYEM